MKRFLLLLSLVLTPALQAKPHVVVSFSILGDMVKTVGGDHIQVTTLVGPNQDAHVYEPRPKDAENIARADGVFINGLGFEKWMERLIKASGYKGPLITATKGIQPLYVLEKENKVPDPHAWHSPQNGLVYVDNVIQGLALLDPEHRTTFEENGAALKQEIQTIDQHVSTALATVLPEDRLIITAHDAFQYLGHAYAIAFKAPVGINTDADPSAKDMAILIGQIREHKAKALFIENIANPKLIQQLSAETGVAIGGTLYSDALSLPGESGGTYPQLLSHNLRLILKALK